MKQKNKEEEYEAYNKNEHGELYAIKFTIELTKIEPYIMRTTKTLLFEGDFFKDCETIEEIAQEFMKNYTADNGRVDTVDVSLFLTKEDYENNNVFEYMCGVEGYELT
jgi:thiol-disulfide isomerase/thioredoxin